MATGPANHAVDRIVISDLLVRGVIGLNDWERSQPQDILVNIVMFTDVRHAGESDDPVGILNYRSVAKDVIRYVESSAPLLVETLATSIARICICDHGAARAIVRVEKPGALRFARSVGVEIDRAAADFRPRPQA
jgi:FolB domain-containing protein